MKEKIKKFWGDHKEGIKTSAILVLTPMAVLGVLSARSLDNFLGVMHDASELVLLEKKKGEA